MSATTDSPQDQVTLSEEAVSAPQDPVLAERDALLQERADLQAMLLRRQADFENFRRRAEKERIENSEYAAMDAVKALLPVLDDFERAIAAESSDKDYAKGMELIYQRTVDTLKKLGLEPMDTAGVKFDPHLHHAIEMVNTAEAEDQTVLGEFQKGYHFKGRLLRPALVRVAVK